jgi:hypothetical protein
MSPFLEDWIGLDFSASFISCSGQPNRVLSKLRVKRLAGHFGDPNFQCGIYLSIV